MKQHPVVLHLKRARAKTTEAGSGAIYVLRELTKQEGCPETASICKFNDEKGRKKSEVIALFDRAIEDAKKLDPAA